MWGDPSIQAQTFCHQQGSAQVSGGLTCPDSIVLFHDLTVPHWCVSTARLGPLEEGVKAAFLLLLVLLCKTFSFFLRQEPPLSSRP